jgi:hypothetical protein
MPAIGAAACPPLTMPELATAWEHDFAVSHAKVG